MAVSRDRKKCCGICGKSWCRPTPCCRRCSALVADDRGLYYLIEQQPLRERLARTKRIDGLAVLVGAELRRRGAAGRPC